MGKKIINGIFILVFTVTTLCLLAAGLASSSINTSLVSLAIFTAFFVLIILNFDSIKEFKFFGLYTKFKEKVDEADKITKELNKLKVIQTRNYVEMLIQTEVRRNRMFEKSGGFDFSNIDKKIKQLEESLKFSQSDKKYIFTPYYNYLVYDILEKIPSDKHTKDKKDASGKYFDDEKYNILHQPNNDYIKNIFSEQDIFSFESLLRKHSLLTDTNIKFLSKCREIIQRYLN